MEEKVVLIGAGSAVFTRGLVADVIRKGWEGEIRLVDIDPDALAVAEGLARKMTEASGAPLAVSASTDRTDVLPGATAVVCTVGVGGRRAWEKDVFIPRTYGIFQPVGDTVMPGGTSRALRMIHAMVEIARDVTESAPDALFFNYSNPMAAICRAVRKATGAEMVGLCHGVFGVASYLEEKLGLGRDELDYTAVGMNHLTWFTELSSGGRDLKPRLLETAEAELAKGINPKTLGARFAEAGDGEEGAENPFSWELTRLLGAFPACRDRHVTEFFGRMFAAEGSYYGKTLGVDAYIFEATIANGDRGFEQMRADALSDEPIDVSYLKRSGGEHEKVTSIIESIRNDAGRIYSANIPNSGQVRNLPPDAVIECPAKAGAGGFIPVEIGDIDPAIAGTLATRMQWVETVADAALEGSRDRFVQALILDGAVESVDQAGRLADELLAAHAEHLPMFA